MMLMLLVPMPIPQLNGRVRHITQYVLLGPGGAALQTLHWVAGDGHLLRDGLEHRRDVPVDCIIHNYQKLMMLVPMPIPQLNGRMRHMI